MGGGPQMPTPATRTPTLLPSPVMCKTRRGPPRNSTAGEMRAECKLVHGELPTLVGRWLGGKAVIFYVKSILQHTKKNLCKICNFLHNHFPRSLIFLFFMLPSPLNSSVCGGGNQGGLSLKVCRSRDETGLVLLAHRHDLYLTILFFIPSNP